MRIGISGYATSGKDEVASVLVEHFGFVRVNMSDALVRDLLLLDPMIETYRGQASRLSDLLSVYTYDDAKARFPDLRRMLQIYGTDVWRSVDPDVWVRRAERSAAGFDRVVTTGIRFENELYGIDRLIHVVRPGVGPVNAHVSDSGIEAVISRSDATVVNDGSLEQLRDRVLAIVGPWLA